MEIGFNIIARKEYQDKIFPDRLSIIEFLRKVWREERLPYNIAVFGLEELLYQAEDLEKISRYISNLLQDAANFLVRGNYIIQIIIEGELFVVETYERPRVRYKNKEFLLYPIFGKVKQIGLKHFVAPLNLQS